MDMWPSPPGRNGKRLSAPPGPAMKGSASAPLLLPSIHPHKKSQSSSGSTESGKGIYGRNWTTEQKRLLHEIRERSWLREKGKTKYINFSDSERAELRRYFDALAGPASDSGTKGQDALGKRIRIDKLEDMLISLGLAENRQEVNNIVEAIDENKSGELDFEQYLTIVRTRADSNLYQVFKAMMEGKLGDSNLNFRTVISTYRRQLILDATGARHPDEQDPVKKVERAQAMTRGNRILKNFAALQKSRYAELESRGEIKPDNTDCLPFDGSGYVPPGGLEMLWRGVCQDHNLVSSRPASADGRSKRTLDPPLSPRTIVESIVPANAKPRTYFSGSRETLIISAPDNSALTRRSPDKVSH